MRSATTKGEPLMCCGWELPSLRKMDKLFLTSNSTLFLNVPFGSMNERSSILPGIEWSPTKNLAAPLDNWPSRPSKAGLFRGKRHRIYPEQEYFSFTFFGL